MEYGGSGFDAKEGFMSVLSLFGIVLAAYLAAGRLGVVAACLVAGVSPHKIFILVILIDVCQIPVYGIILEYSQWHKILPSRLQKWIKNRSGKIQNRMEASSLWNRVSRFQPLAIMAVSLLPLRGFGIFSACILSFMLNLNRVYATILIMGGSVIGTILSILIFYFPVRWMSVLYA
jgi:uncharacterized membrane protein